MNVVFIVTLFILFFSILQGWRKGILGLVFGFVSWIFVLVFIAFSHTYIEDYLRSNTKVYDKVYEKTADHLERKALEEGEQHSLEEWWDTLTDGMPRNISDSLLVDVKTEVSNNVADAKMQILEQVAVRITDFILQGIAVLIAFVLAEIIVSIVGGIVKSVGKVPVIKEVNSFLGIIAGAVEGVLVIWILMYIVACICGTALGERIISDIDASTFLSYLYHHNLIMVFVSTI